MKKLLTYGFAALALTAMLGAQNFTITTRLGGDKDDLWEDAFVFGGGDPIVNITDENSNPTYTSNAALLNFGARINLQFRNDYINAQMRLQSTRALGSGGISWLTNQWRIRGQFIYTPVSWLRIAYGQGSSTVGFAASQLYADNGTQYGFDGSGLSVLVYPIDGLIIGAAFNGLSGTGNWTPDFDFGVEYALPDVFTVDAMVKHIAQPIAKTGNLTAGGFFRLNAIDNVGITAGFVWNDTNDYDAFDTFAGNVGQDLGGDDNTFAVPLSAQYRFGDYTIAGDLKLGFGNANNVFNVAGGLSFSWAGNGTVSSGVELQAGTVDTDDWAVAAHVPVTITIPSAGTLKTGLRAAVNNSGTWRVGIPLVWNYQVLNVAR